MLRFKGPLGEQLLRFFVWFTVEFFSEPFWLVVHTDTFPSLFTLYILQQDVIICKMLLFVFVSNVCIAAFFLLLFLLYSNLPLHRLQIIDDVPGILRYAANFRTNYTMARIYTSYSEGKNGLHTFVVIYNSIRSLWILPGNQFYFAWHSSHFEHWLSESYLEKIKWLNMVTPNVRIQLQLAIEKDSSYPDEVCDWRTKQ